MSEPPIQICVLLAVCKNRAIFEKQNNTHPTQSSPESINNGGTTVTHVRRFFSCGTHTAYTTIAASRLFIPIRITFYQLKDGSISFEG